MASSEPPGLIDAAEAARMLGVKPATLYSYVSRGLLGRRRDDDGRRSLFDRVEVLALKHRAHPPQGDGQELVFTSAVTILGNDRPYFRGTDACALARSESYEAVAELLWSGRVPAARPTWSALPGAVSAAAAAQATLPADAFPLDRLQVIVTTLAVSDPMRFNLDVEAVAATGRALIAGMVEALPLRSARKSPPHPGIAARLWPRLTGARPEPELLAALDAALAVLADHELAASTLAARVAASVKADPYAVVSAALGVVGGPMHGGASLGVERMLTEVTDPGRAAQVIGERLRRGDRIPGVGHAVYKHGDARAELVLELLHAAVPGHPRLAAADGLRAEVETRRLPPINVDFAVATLGAVAGMVAGAAQAIFAIARTAGWLAHALEEYARRSPPRPRAVYVGTLPTSG